MGIIDSNIHFKRKIIARKPVILRNIDYRDNLTYVLFPGDSLAIYLDEHHFLSLKSLKDSTRNEELNFFNSLRVTEPQMAYFKLGKNITDNSAQTDFMRDVHILYTKTDLTFRAQYALQKYHDQLNFLKQYNQQYHIRSISYHIFEEMFYDDYLYTKIKIANALLKANNPIDESLEKKLSQFRTKIFKADFLYNLTYRLSIQYYLDYLMIKNKIPLTAKNEYIVKEFKGKVKDFLLFTATKKALEEQAYDEQLIKFFDANCGNADYKKEIKNIAELSIPTKESILLDQQNKRINFDALVKQNKGKVLYVDFWASWCVPCIQQIPSALVLQKDFKNLPVQFYYISLDKSNSPWKEMSTQLKLKGDQDYILINDFNSPLAKSLKISSIPRHIIINKKGEIVSRDAPSPLDERLKPLLLKLTKE